MLEEEIKAQAEKSCIMIDKKDRACYVAGYLGGYEAAETERQEYEKKLLQSNLDQQNKIVFLSQKVNDLQKAYDKQKEINKEQVDELEDWKAEWKNQNMVATEEAWERTKLTGDVKNLEQQLQWERDTKAELADLLGKANDKIADLEKENAELKETVIKMNNVITETFSNLTKAKEIIEKVAKMYRYSPRVDEIIEQAEQFLDGESTTEQSNECHDCAKFDEMPKGPRCKTCDNGSHFQKKEQIK